MRRELHALARDTHGAITIVALFMVVFLVALLLSLIDLGQVVLYRERMQAAADAAAFSSAVMHARGMNLIAFVNMVMAALLAVLVALNLMETVIVVGTAVLAAASAASLGTCVSCAGGLLALNDLRETVAQAREAVKQPIASALRMLHTAERGLRVLVPYASELATLQTLADYEPPVRVGFALPPRATLPVSDDSYATLCEHAGADVATLALLPFAGIEGADKVIGAAKGALESLVAANPAWFCAGTAASKAQRTFETPIERVFPRTAARRACERADVLSDAGQAACSRATDEDERARPDAVTGACEARCERALYDEHARLARRECDPTQHPKRYGYVWQERSVVRHFVAERSRLRWLPAEDEVSQPRRVVADDPPCKGADTWNDRWPDDGSESAPVCSFVTNGDGSTRQTLTEVLQVFQCQGRGTITHEIADLSHDPTLGGHDAADTSRSPLMLEPGVERDARARQIRAVVIGDLPRGYAAAIGVAAWGEASAAGAPSSAHLPRALEQLQVAQADYYFAGRSRDPREWLWSMSWRARLRRFRMPSASAQTEPPVADAEGFDIPSPALDFDTACGAVRGCEGLRDKLVVLGEWIVH